MILDNVDRFRVMEPMFEAVRVVLAHRGEKYSPAYIQGISGAAFRIAGICPCAPTCSTQMHPKTLVAILGYTATEHILGWKDDDVADKMREFTTVVKDSIRAGRPIMVWHAFTNAEWDVVAGFDDAAGVFLGRGSYAGLDGYAKAKQGRAAEAVRICPAFGALVIGEKTGKLDAPAAEIAALKEAVRHANDRKGVEKLGGKEWVLLQGLVVYDRWCSDWRKAEKTRDTGDSYCFNIYRSTHRAAGDFLREIAPRHGKATDLLLTAAACFTAEADTLDRAEPLLNWQAPKGPDAERNAKVAPILEKAMGHYAEGIKLIGEAVAKLG